MIRRSVMMFFVFLLAVSSADAQRMLWCDCKYCMQDPRNWNHKGNRMNRKTVSPRPVLKAPSPGPAAEPVYRTPQEAIDALFEMWDLGPDSVLLDIGCGEGDVLIAAAQRFGCQCIGIEIDRDRADAAREKRRAAGIDQNQLTIIKGDAKANGAIYSGATHVFAYWHAHDLKDVIDLIPETALMVTYHFGVPGRSHRITQRGHTFYLIER